ncbi:MAG: hypothetical protein ACKPHU_00550, partial [Planctomycetaceae bacterium]
MARSARQATWVAVTSPVPPSRTASDFLSGDPAKLKTIPNPTEGVQTNFSLGPSTLQIRFPVSG